MGLSQILSCCPWRLPNRRPLTPYEWTVVEADIHDGIVHGMGVGFTNQTKALAVSLTMAISQQNRAPNWKTSAFGPAPAVAGYQYGCLGSWFGSLDPASKQRVLVDIMNTDLLNSPTPPWVNCPRAVGDLNWRPGIQTEYNAQRGSLPGPGVLAEPCSLERYRTFYVPMTGAQIIEVMRMVGGGVLDPQLQQMIEVGGNLFADRSFLIGFETKAVPTLQNIPPGLTGNAAMKALLDAMIEDLALIWAPGKGVSIRSVLTTGTLDPQALAALINGLAPDVIGDFFKGLPAIIPGLIPPLGSMNVTQGLDAAPRSFSDPSTPPTTGLQVVDQDGSAQDDTPPTEKAEGQAVGIVLAGIGAALLFVLFMQRR